MLLATSLLNDDQNVENDEFFEVVTGIIKDSKILENHYDLDEAPTNASSGFTSSYNVAEYDKLDLPKPSIKKFKNPKKNFFSD